MYPTEVASSGPEDYSGRGSLHIGLTERLFGVYNTTCQFDTDCFDNLNLVCKNGVCVCIKGFIPDQSGACDISSKDLMLVWAIRFAITAAVLLFCVFVLYCLFSKAACCRHPRDSRGNLLDTDHQATDNCWQEAPPPYLEVVCPPPSYIEAVAKMPKPPAYSDGTSATPHLERSNSICNLFMTTESAAPARGSGFSSTSSTKNERGWSSPPSPPPTPSSSPEIGADAALHL